MAGQGVARELVMRLGSTLAASLEGLVWILGLARVGPHEAPKVPCTCVRARVRACAQTRVRAGTCVPHMELRPVSAASNKINSRTLPRT